MRTHPTILGISPGTRVVGLAIKKNSELVEWRVKTFKGCWNFGKLRDIQYELIKYVAKYNVKMIVLKSPDGLRSSSALNKLVSEITVWAKMNRIKIVSYTLQELKDSFTEGRDSNKAEMIKQLVTAYPELRMEYSREQKNKNPYYIKMFEAIALVRMIKS